MIYFIRDESAGMVKVGTAECPRKRLALLQTGNPNPLDLIGTLPGGRDEEARLHRQFAVYRGRGEWFRADREFLSAVYEILSVGTLYRNVWEECRRRNRCRAGLPGVSMFHVPSGTHFGCRTSSWGRGGELLLYTERPGSEWPAPRVGIVSGREVVERMATLPPPPVFRAADCVLVSVWPVVCCPPSGEPIAS